MTAVHTPVPSGLRQRVIDLYLILRVSTLGFTLMLPLLGAAFAQGAWSAAHSAWLLAVALAFHAFAYMLNDVVDLDIDRTEAQRFDSPLVRGTMSPRVVLVVALVSVPVAFGLAWAGGLSLPWLALAFAAMAAYDVWGKRCRWPLVTDAVQALGWCALMVVGVPDGAATWSHAWLAAYLFVCVLIVQGVHGGLRDLANDRRRGARTTAAWLGALERPGAGVDLPPRFVAYAASLQAVMIASACGVWWTARDAGASIGGHAGAGAVAVASLVVAGASLLFAWRRRSDARALVNAGAWHIVASLVVPLALASASLPAAGVALLAAVFALPVAAMWAYNGTHWHLTPPLPGEAAR